MLSAIEPEVEILSDETVSLSSITNALLSLCSERQHIQEGVTLSNFCNTRIRLGFGSLGNSDGQAV